MALLEIQNLSKSYPAPVGPDTQVLDVPAFEMDTGSRVAIHGESGSGKTTFLHLVAGILRPDKGTILLEGQDLTQLPESNRDRLRASSIGYVFQTFNLLQGFTCLENVMLGMSFGSGVNESRARELLEKVDLADRLSYRPSQLSVGQQQRVAVARALANKPKLVLADEPTGNLDPKNSRAAIDLIQQLCDEEGSGLMLVSHDLKVVDSFPKQLSWASLNRVISKETRT